MLIVLAWNHGGRGSGPGALAVAAEDHDVLTEMCRPCVGPSGKSGSSSSLLKKEQGNFRPATVTVPASHLTLFAGVADVARSILHSMEDEDDASVVVSGALDGAGLPMKQAPALASERQLVSGIVTGSSRKELRFDSRSMSTGIDGQVVVALQTNGDAHDEPGKRRSSRVAPAPLEGGPAENRSQSSAGLSKATASGLHRMIEAGLHVEDGILTLLRRLLVVLSFVVIGLSLATTIISKGVISQGVSAATLATMKGDLPVIQQVRGPRYRNSHVISPHSWHYACVMLVPHVCRTSSCGR